MSEQAEDQPAHAYQCFLESLPKDWDRKEIQQLGKVVGGGTPSRDVPSFWSGAIPWLTPGEVSGNATKLLYDTEEHISTSGLAGSGANILPAGSLMVTTRATLGARAINAVPMATNQGFKSIVFNHADDANFYIHLFEKVQPELVRRASGTTFLEISGAEFGRIEMPSPSPEEKRQIGEVFDTLDTAIHETEGIIAKLQAVKQGLLHDLLTRGIDANGELRPPQAEAPHLYDLSPLGWIPKDWGVRGVLDVAPPDRQCILTGPFGADLGQSDFRSEGVPVLRIGNVQAGYIDWSDTQFVTPEKATRLGKYRVAAGDLLFARQGATTGRNALADQRANGALVNYHIIRVAVDHRQCHPTYLYSLFNSEAAKSQVDQSKGRGTREGINSEQIASLRFALPQPDEQREAVARMESIDASISNESLTLNKFRLEKAGLMHDLLTGRVRVTPLISSDGRQDG